MYPTVQRSFLFGNDDYNSKQMQQNTILKYHVCLDKNKITAADLTLDYKTHYDEYFFIQL